MIKDQLYLLCLNFIEQRIETAKTALKQAQEASNDDTKSSAGDKFETGREMAQQDIDRNKRLLMDAETNLNLLKNIKQNNTSDKIVNGSLVYTNSGNFYISISAGELKTENGIFFAISALSPLGKTMLGKQKNETFDFNGRKYVIKTVA